MHTESAPAKLKKPESFYCNCCSHSYKLVSAALSPVFAYYVLSMCLVCVCFEVKTSEFIQRAVWLVAS